MTETNLNIVLSNALCCSSQLATKVSKLYDTGNLCVDTEFDKLKLLIDKIEVLKCYGFPTQQLGLTTNSEFTIILTNIQYNTLLNTNDLTIQLDVNGTIYTLYSDSVNTGLELIINKLTELGFFISYSVTIDGRLTYIDLTLTCNILNVNYSVQYLETAPIEYFFTNTVLGSCFNYIEVPAQNCLTEEQADIMMHDVMRQCDICDCQLTT